MTQRTFTLLFMLVCFIILITLSELNILDYIAKFSVVVILIAYSAGQYSTRFCKEKK